MRIKAVEGIKAYNITVARISPGCVYVCLRTYIHPFIPLYFGLSVRAFVNGSRPFSGHRIAASVVSFGYRYPRNFLNKIFLKNLYDSLYISSLNETSLLERELTVFSIFFGGYVTIFQGQKKLLFHKLFLTNNA